jgi:hypothetical protein
MLVYRSYRCVAFSLSYRDPEELMQDGDYAGDQGSIQRRVYLRWSPDAFSTEPPFPTVSPLSMSTDFARHSVNRLSLLLCSVSSLQHLTRREL